MRIISGIYKGRNLEGFDLEGTRPTMDRVKESLFAMIQDFIPNSVVLDLFSGSGNLGIEALSEGAKLAYLVDSNYKAVQVIQKNIEMIPKDDVVVLCKDFEKALDTLKEEKIKFDVIFLDPPYRTNYIEKSIEKVSKNDLLKEDGILVCESDQIDKIIYPESYKVLKEKKYGDKYIVILKKI